MLRYVLKRILMMIPVLLAVSFVVYFLMDLAPGDAVMHLAPTDATAEQIEQLRKDLGLDGPLLVRYFRYVGNLLKGDLGRSVIQKFPCNCKTGCGQPCGCYWYCLPSGHRRRYPPQQLAGRLQYGGRYAVGVHALFLAGPAADHAVLLQAGHPALRR